ncbi:MAG TPA: hypothetical protein VNQ78_18065 [Paracoccus sp. (in: a-proteobacteria)]|uniref:hypothetical protein n=1 Tax=Paracoccus sp. TaxID=267 RepID=UPI002D147DA7|nr:hypothetical protein [Paracoccus sp. (in: a-proteobacteria)]HWL58567.1 hypothetical protein [Paracoccus sp. (in: a-proteobacteria)]
MRIIRLTEILQDEGVSGIYSRLRFPKTQGGGWAPSPITAEVSISGKRPDLQECLTGVLRRAGRRVVPARTRAAVTRFHIDPDLGPSESYGANDVLILSRKAGPHLAQIALHSRGAQAVIELCPDRYQKLAAMGIERDRLFLAAGGLDGFALGIYRFLLATRAIDPDAVDWRSLVPEFPASAGNMPRLCLSLGEVRSRRQFFLEQGPRGFLLCDGLRQDPGWIGAAIGYRAMAQACLARGFSRAIFCEDDVEIAPDFEIRLEKVMAYLDGRDWDVFSGLSTHVRQGYSAHRVEDFRGETFLHLNRTTGMVFNIVNRRALERLAGWRYDDHGLRGVTIDAHLEAMPEMRAVTTLPFLVDHCDALSSTAWGFSNRRYRGMITTSQQRLAAMAAARTAPHPGGF